MAEVNLPEGWISSTIDEVVLNTNGARKPISLSLRAEIQGPYPYYGATGQIDSLNNFTHEGEHILIGEDGANLLSKSKDLAFIVNGQFWVNNHAHAVKCLADVPAKYIASYINSLDLTPYVTGSAQPKLTKGNLDQIPVPLPPLAEQKVIAEKLDTLLAQVDNTKASLERIPEILKRFRQSVLAAAVSGKLTEEWRNQNDVEESSQALLKRWLNERKLKFDNQQKALVKQGKIKKVRTFKEPAAPDLDTSGKPTMPDSWICVSVSEFAECLDNLRVPVKKDERQVSEGLYPYFGANGEVDRVDEFIFDGDLVMVTEDETFYGRVKPIAYRYTGKCWVNNHAHVLTAPTKEANDFLCFSLMYYKVIPWLSGTTGRAKLTQAALNSLPIALPPVKEQIEIVRRVEELFAFADRIEHAAQAALSRVNNLTQSILAKAFRGELTADWRAANPELINGENSAEALLARIKAERAKVKPKPKKAN